MSFIEGVVPRRRNGRQQACEPCRKRKLACDHGLPTCQRCIRRKVTAGCVYLAAPMTTSNSQKSHYKSISSTATPSFTHSPPLNLPLASPQNVESKISSPSTLFSNSSGFLGPTSFSAVFLENRSRLDPMPSRAMQEQVSQSTEDPYSTHFIEMGIKVLDQLPDQNTCQSLFNRFMKGNDSWNRIATDYCMKSMWSIFGDHLAQPRSTHDLQTMSSLLCKNGNTPLEESEDSQQWLGSFTGYKLRWEALGILFISMGYGAMSSPEGDAIFMLGGGQRRDRMKLVYEMKDAATSCIALSGRTDFLNPLMVYLHYVHNLLQSVCSGDTCPRVWRQHGELVSVTTALGLHRDADTETSKINIATQMRRRIFASVFHIDKSVAMFTGRPPSLSHRYCSCPSPLDISDEALMSGGMALSNAISSLDQNGWNTDGEIYHTTTLRTCMSYALIRDEILELALGSAPDNVVAERIEELKPRSERDYAGFPSQVKYHPGDEFKNNINDRDLWTKLWNRMEYLHNRFLMERLSYKYRHSDGQMLMDVSREMLSLSLMFWTHRDRFIGRLHDYEWMMMCHGVPPSGVLCVELLKQTKERQDHSSRLKLPRSETIQNLSMFVGCLNWVKPTAPNSDLCFRIRGIISRVLDEVLDAPPPSQESQAEPQTAYDFELPSDFPEYEVMNNFDLLDTFDWTRGNWMGWPSSQ